jgi:hypothetical protein
VRVTIVAPGSRGDIQPYLALGVGLTRRGHAAKVVTTLDHAALVAASGLDFVPVAIDVQAALRGDRAAGRLEGGGVIASFRELASIARRGARLTAEVTLEATRGADALVTGFGAVFLADAVARQLGVPLIQAFNVPLTPTGAFSGALAPGLSFGPRSRRLGHWITRQALWTTMRASANQVRAGLLVREAGGGEMAVLAPERLPGRHEPLHAQRAVGSDEGPGSPPARTSRGWPTRGSTRSHRGAPSTSATAEVSHRDRNTWQSRRDPTRAELVPASRTFPAPRALSSRARRGSWRRP